MTSFITEHQRLKMVAKLQAKLARQTQVAKDTEAELLYWGNLEIPLTPPKGK